MLLADERDIFFYDIKIKSNSRAVVGLPPVKANVIVDELIKLYENDNAYKEYKNKTEVIYISDIQLDTASGLVKILINRSDQNTADTILSNIQRGTRRVIKKEQGEGNDNSSHVIWVLNETPKKPNYYLLISEYSPGLGRGKVEAFINALLWKCAKIKPELFSIKHPDGSVDKKGNPKKINFRPMVELHGHLSKEFKEELRAGKFLGLEVYTPYEQQPYDAYKYTEEKNHTVQLVLSEKGKTAEKWALVKSVCAKAHKDNQDFLRIRFENSEGANRSIQLHTESVDVAKGFIYIKKRKVKDFSKALLSSYEEINPEIINKMTALIGK